MSDSILERCLSPGYRQSRQDELAGWRNLLCRTPASGYVSTCVAIRDADMGKAAKAISVPTLVLAGEADLATPPELVSTLAERIPGIDASHVPDPDPEADSFRPPSGIFLVARAGDAVLGCVSLKLVEPGLGEVKRLWVAPEARGHGLARRLMAEVEAFARSAGMTRLRLDTNSALTEALSLYRKTGWHPTTPFTKPFPATDWFAKRL